MAYFDSIPEIVAGVAVEVVVFGIVAGVIYRFLSGRFLIPKREIVLPNQRGVVVQGENILRVAEPGSCWIRPKQRIVLCDMRPRPLQMAGLEIICSNAGIVRLSLSGRYQIADAAAYYTGSSNAGDAIFVELRRAIAWAARQQSSSAIVAAPEAFAQRIREAAAPAASKLGLEISELDIWDALFVGRYAATEKNENDFGDSPETMVH
jgi:regulator of protease activity HflC (stomatin/prohibitin superfamily)